jgi:nicotinate-nucleotide adenylyltransferase
LTGRRPVVGVLGGSFDPVHLGHLRIAAEVRKVLRLDQIDLLLSPRPPHKAPSALTPPGARAEMIRLAIQDRPGLRLSLAEFDDGGPNYTIDTLRRCRTVSRPTDPIFIIGTDSLFQLDSWHRSQELTREFDFVVVDRPGSELADRIEALDRRLASRIVPLIPLPPAGGTRGSSPGSGGRIFTLSLPLTAESSSQIREFASRDLPLDGLVPPAVAKYISDLGLYRTEETS